MREISVLLVDEAANGPEAIRLARELRPRVIVMDMAMPGLDAVQATRAIRGSGRRGAGGGANG